MGSDVSPRSCESIVTEIVNRARLLPHSIATLAILVVHSFGCWWWGGDQFGYKLLTEMVPVWSITARPFMGALDLIQPRRVGSLCDSGGPVDLHPLRWRGLLPQWMEFDSGISQHRSGASMGLQRHRTRSFARPPCRR